MSLWEKEGRGTMSGSEIVKKKARELTPKQSAELAALADRVRGRLQQSAADILALGADLIRAKAMLGHGRFGAWLDVEFAQSRRSAEQFISAARRFATRSEAVSHLPAGSVIELSAPSVPKSWLTRSLLVRFLLRSPPSEKRRRRPAARIVHMRLLEPSSTTSSASTVREKTSPWRSWPTFFGVGRIRLDREWLLACLEVASERLTDNLGRRVSRVGTAADHRKRLKREQVR
jgi:hypothetical protein